MHLKKLHRNGEIKKLLENVDPKIASFLIEQSDTLDKCIARITELEENLRETQRLVKVSNRLSVSTYKNQGKINGDNNDRQETVHKQNSISNK